MSGGSHRPHDEPPPAAEPGAAAERADNGPDVDAAGAGAGSEPLTVAGNAVTLQDPAAG